MSWVRFDASALARTKWYEYGVRILFGGAITVVTGILAKRYGPVFGGLFLAFPAIFPASATLVEKHERQTKERAGIKGSIRGRLAAALDARGAVMGGFGLVLFAVTMWQLLTRSAPLAFALALLAWLAASVAIWLARRPGLSRRLKQETRS
jgi:hypothetical protein